ncbi:MAG: potassium channel family protein, partial [Bacteroidetes bacterium]|nr:potassium channel family protein [Bacteroidota bacterium]
MAPVLDSPGNSHEQLPKRAEVVYAVLFLVLWMVVGTLGYSFLENWSLMDGLYMAFITLTTIGYTEVHDLSHTGRIFTIVFGLVGIGAAGVVSYRSARLLIAGTVIRKRRRMYKIRHMND